jgi:predicted permease
LLRPLDYRDPDQLVFLHSEFRGLGFDKFGISPPEYREIQQNMRSLTQVGAWSTGSVSLSSTESPVRITTAFAGAEVFATLGVAPQIGRTYTLEEDRADVNLGVISHRLWQTAFGADPGVIGQSVEMNGVQVPVIGIMPEGFDLGEAGIDLWIPLGISLNPTNSRLDHFLNLVGRLAPDATLEQAQREMGGLLGRWDELAPGDHVPTASDHPMHIKSLRDEVVGDVRPALLLLLGAVGFVLLIACANVANLLLARAEGRQKEIAVRTALGAGRSRIVRQFLTESILLALVGGVFGLILGHAGLRALVATNAESIPRIGAVGLDPQVLLFTLAVSLLTGALFGIAPLLHSQRGLSSALREGSNRTTASTGRQRLRRALIISEVALAVVLLVGSGLLLRSFAALQEVDPGFDPDGLLTFGIYLPYGNYPEPTDITAFHGRLIERLEALPGTTGAALMSGLPPMRDANATNTDFEGKQAMPGGPPQNVDYYQVVTSEYFETMKIPLVDGRLFTPADDAAATPVAIINETLARVFYPGENPIGQRIRPPGGDAVPWLTIIGVARDVKQGGISQPTGTELYFHEPQAGLVDRSSRALNVVVRTDRPPLSIANEVRQAVWSEDPSLPLAGVQTMEDTLAGTMSRPRFLSFLLSIFAAVALVLAAVGIYGVLSYAVAERTKEIGIRMALGAEARGVVAMVLRDGLAVAVVGLALGLLGAFATTRLLESQLFGVGSADPATFVAVPLVLLVVALVASYVPARRASSVAPIVALRKD